MSGFASISKVSGQGAGGTNTSNAASTTQFGEALVAQLNPAAQATFVNGLNPTTFITRSIGTGASVFSSGGMAYLDSGTSITGSAAIQMRRGLTYRPGQGSIFRGTAIFGPPVANAYQLLGFGNVESGYYFGYNGTNFGIHHFPDGYREVRKLTVSAGVATSTNVTVTLNGESKTYSISGGGTVNQTSWEISQQDWTNVGGGWVAESYDGVIYFIALRPGARGGTYSASGTGLTATFTTFITGATANATFISQSAWNIDTMDGNGPSRMVLNPEKGNVYQVGFQYLGFGNARFAIEDPQSGQFQACHMIRNANTRLTPVLKDPHVGALWAVSNAGSTTSTHMTGTSGAIFCEGAVLRNIGPAFSAYALNTNVDTAEIPVLTVRSNRIFGSKAGYSEIDISTLSATIVASSAAQHAVLRIYKNLRLTGPVNFTNVNATQSIASYDTAATGFSANQNTLVATYVIPFGGSINVDLKGDNFFLSVGESLTITSQGSTNGADTAVALTWFEDQ
jgi:hypothetical protein